MSEPEFMAIPSLRIFDFMRPGIEPTLWHSRLMEVNDPFNSRLRFDEVSAPPEDDG